MLATLRQRNFSLVWTAGLISYIGDWMLVTALGFYVYQITQAVISTGLLFIAYIVPTLIFGSVAGVFADLRDRKWIMIVANALRAVLLLLLLMVDTAEEAWLIYVIVFIESLITIFFTAAENALMPNLVSEQDLMAANALNSLNDNLARLIGPSLGGAALAVLGMSSVVIADIASYVMAGVLLLGVTVSGRPAAPPAAAQPNWSARWRSFWQEWLAGLRFVLEDRLVSALLLITAVTEIAGSIVNVLIVAFVTHQLLGTALEFGWLMTARGIGGIIAGALVAQMGRRVSPARLIPVCLLGMGAAFLIIFNVPNLLLALPLMLLFGFLAVTRSVSDRTLLQANTQDSYRGRIFGFYFVTIALVSLGGTGVSGAVGDSAGVPFMLNLASWLLVGAGFLSIFLLRRALPAIAPTPREEPADS